MNNIVLFAPEIPQNTGAIARTCAATGTTLHLIKPLGFDISDAAVKRAGLDYWHLVDVRVYENVEEYLEKNGDENLWLLSTKASRSYAEADMSGGVSLMFGRETSGLPEELMRRYHDRSIRIPMKPRARSLNLAASAGIILYDALRQQGFPGLMEKGILAIEDDFQ
ncbi:MAG: tRNA (cytidine(34)-2'-O)-methyltransferase [Oscillospiraceae bacterium]